MNPNYCLFVEYGSLAYVLEMAARHIPDEPLRDVFPSETEPVPVSEIPTQVCLTGATVPADWAA